MGIRNKKLGKLFKYGLLLGKKTKAIICYLCYFKKIKSVACRDPCCQTPLSGANFVFFRCTKSEILPKWVSQAFFNFSHKSAFYFYRREDIKKIPQSVFCKPCETVKKCTESCVVWFVLEDYFVLLVATLNLVANNPGPHFLFYSLLILLL